jgi:hypothetical protein
MNRLGIVKGTLLSLATAGLLLGAGCQDKQCKTDLKATQASVESAQKTIGDLQTENTSLKEKAGQVDQLMAQLSSVTRELETLKAGAPGGPTGVAAAPATP